MNHPILKINGKTMVIVLLLITVSSTAVFGSNDQIKPSTNDQGSWEINISIVNNEESTYEGRIRLFLVEPISSINNYNGDPFHFGVTDIIINEEILVDTTDEINLIFTEDDVNLIDDENNMLLVALYNSDSNEQYAYPPDGNSFDAHYVDAAAAAFPNSEGNNEKTEGFTHTVLVEEVATTNCRYCPVMGETLFDIYQSNDYPFYFITLIYGADQKVNKRISDEFNVGPVPVAFFDGGYGVFLGGSSNQNDYRNLIENAGQREVHDLDLSLSIQWNEDLVFPPTVHIDRPEKGIYLFNELKKEFDKPLIIGSFTIEATAYDNESGIERVDFYINDELRSTDRFSPYKYNNWKESKLFGQYTIRVVAYDEFGYQNNDEIDVIRIF